MDPEKAAHALDVLYEWSADNPEAYRDLKGIFLAYGGHEHCARGNALMQLLGTMLLIDWVADVKRDMKRGVNNGH